jgi:hypothetical protein
MNNILCINRQELDYFGDSKKANIVDGATLAYVDSAPVTRNILKWKNKSYKLVFTQGNNWAVLELIP